MSYPSKTTSFLFQLVVSRFRSLHYGGSCGILTKGRMEGEQALQQLKTEECLNALWDKRELAVRVANPTKTVADPTTRATCEVFEKMGPVLIGLREFREALKHAPQFDETKTTLS